MLTRLLWRSQVFRAHTDGHLRVLNSFFPPAVARFLRLQPLSWHGRASAQVQVLGCPVSKVTSRIRSSDSASPRRSPVKRSASRQAADVSPPTFPIPPAESPPMPDKPRTDAAPTATEGPVLVETRPSE